MSASCDSLLGLNIPKKSRLIGYVGEVAPLVSGRTVEQEQTILGVLIESVNDKEVHRKRLPQVHRRGALRVASGDRIV